MRKILIANRGEIACRIIRSCKELGFRSVAIYSEIDKHLMHVQQADESYNIGKARPEDSYNNIKNIIEVAKSSSVDAIHPGYGFLSENKIFASIIEKLGIIWIGPDSKTIEALGDKKNAKYIAQKLGIKTVPGSINFAINKIRNLESELNKLDFPILIKSSVGGGGIGMKKVESSEVLFGLIEKIQNNLLNLTGSGTIFLENYIQKSRHIEVQVFGNGEGDVINIGTRDCSIQRRFQKIIEEAPAPFLNNDVHKKIILDAMNLMKFAKYKGAGTVEFIFDVDSKDYYFLEVNTRIQVEHTITEEISGIDIVGMQILEAFGENKIFNIKNNIPLVGHSIEFRLCAERPYKNFLPSPGTINNLKFPIQNGVRIETGVKSGDMITPYYDSMIAKIIVRDITRSKAIEKLINVLENTIVDGIETNLYFGIRVLKNKNFKAGNILTNFIELNKDDLLN
jgi:3-methylcrotonyl-CoA carboxylase alpha subunit